MHSAQYMENSHQATRDERKRRPSTSSEHPPVTKHINYSYFSRRTVCWIRNHCTACPVWSRKRPNAKGWEIKGLHWFLFFLLFNKYCNHWEITFIIHLWIQTNESWADSTQVNRWKCPIIVNECEAHATLNYAGNYSLIFFFRTNLSIMLA